MEFESLILKVKFKDSGIVKIKGIKIFYENMVIEHLCDKHGLFYLFYYP